MFDSNFFTAAAENVKEMSIGDAAITAVFGYCVVFCGQTAPEAAPDTEKELPLAPGSAGHVKLFDVPDKEAAMIMAIVADKMQKPLNELHFISIKEVK